LGKFPKAGNHEGAAGIGDGWFLFGLFGQNAYLLAVAGKGVFFCVVKITPLSQGLFQAGPGPVESDFRIVQR